MRDYHFELPADLIAQAPPARRDGGRLLHVGCGLFPFTALPDRLRAGDLLVFNTSRVLPARLLGQKASGGRVEILLERLLPQHGECWAQIRASRAPQAGGVLHTAGGDFTVLGRGGQEDMFFHLRAIGKHGRAVDARRRFLRFGQTPLPPYISRAPAAADARRYQTVFAREEGSVAAPTAGLHFSAAVLRALAAAGIGRAQLHLHVGAGTFSPLRQAQDAQTALHSERYHISAAAARRIGAARAAGGRIVAVGTTTLRALESAALRARQDGGGVAGLATGDAETTLFIRPGHRFATADMLITNFHLPESSLFMLVCAFGGTATLQNAYRLAVRERLRFYSYGDAMLLPRAA